MHHTTCMLSYVLRVKGAGVQACKGKIPPDAHKQYFSLYQKGKMKNESRKWVSDDVVETVDCIQQSAAASLQLSHKEQSTDQVVDSNKMCIEVGFKMTVTNDICQLHDAGLEMIIEDFFHCENIPDNGTKCTSSKRCFSRQGWWERILRFQTGGKQEVIFQCLFYLFCCSYYVHFCFFIFQVYYLTSSKKIHTRKIKNLF